MPEIIARNGAVDLDRESIDYDAIQDPGHGNTPAAWTTVFIILIGAIVATFGNVIGDWMIFWVGVGICVVGPIVGGIMALAGKGASRSSGHRR